MSSYRETWGRRAGRFTSLGANLGRIISGYAIADADIFLRFLAKESVSRSLFEYKIQIAHFAFSHNLSVWLILPSWVKEELCSRAIFEDRVERIGRTQFRLWGYGDNSRTYTYEEIWHMIETKAITWRFAASGYSIIGAGFEEQVADQIAGYVDGE
jgi:hypothetical protein